MKLMPIVFAQDTATHRLAQYLDQLLRPIIELHTKSRTFINGSDFLRKFHDYIDGNKRQFSSTTNFVSITMANFLALVPHGRMLIALQDFLRDSAYLSVIDNVSIGRIIRLTALFLHNNRFYYDGKIYRYCKGAPMNFPLTELLAHVFVYQLQKVLINDSCIQDEFYGR